MKMAPVVRALAKHPAFHSYLVHTGQHYDEAMSGAFFRDLGMRSADFNLNVGSGSHAVQTAEIMKSFEEVCDKVQPHLVMVAGDVNSTLACALTAAKLHIPVAHIEAGLRSFDRSMPEEINRIVTDSVSDALFTTEESGNKHLRHEGVPEDKIHFVGNTMIDSLVDCGRYLDQMPLTGLLSTVNGTPYFLATIHRPSNVDDPIPLSRVVKILQSASELAPVLFVTHPRTRYRLRLVEERNRLMDVDDSLDSIRPGHTYLLPPLAYLQFLPLMAKTKAVLTDSGGIQEETTFLNIPCLTLRDNTERPSTVEMGSNEVVGLDGQKILTCLAEITSGRWKKAATPPLWDGRAAERVVRALITFFGLA
jgi:UDP-N-acetylglucosamine 2-epimerase (non-hydrolysing)